ncbi:bile salt-activated lipase-like [Galendromus occidentalis]|uniref:Bile salt-activated lipase-like n=1 Tax=Galendromus occidentalis TaxID=34638 RepID=A0AAJ6W020_9ACAR|nr:bile salt-activated lipase-like [Galendromus occidentalis]
MFFLALVIGVGLPSVSWSAENFVLTVDGVEYKAECSLQRVILSGGTCPKNCPIEDMCAIRGIPYATASRFERPQALDETSRKEYHEKKEDTVHCAQTDPFTGDTIGVENCLVVDLYFPRDRNQAQTRNLVVLLEGMDFETSLAGFLSPENSPGETESYVLAVVHYRTGVFGFMTLQDELMPANLGLWDQQMAFKFLRDHASALKVNNEFIALGFDTGAVALHLHMLNPISREFFKRVLLSGGNALSPGAVTPDAVTSTMTLASRLKCDNSSMKAVAKCLLKHPKEDLLKHARAEPALRFASVVDADTSESKSSDAFIGAPVEDLMREKRTGKMEVIIHSYPALGGLNLFARNKVRASKEDDDIKYIGKFLDMYGERTAETVANHIFNQYFKKPGVKKDIEKDPSKFIDLLTDFSVGYPVHGLATRQIQQYGDATKVESYLLLDPRNGGLKNEAAPSFAAKLKNTKVDQLEGRYGSTLDDMLLFVGCKKVPVAVRNDDKNSREVLGVVSKNAAIITKGLKCLLDPDNCEAPISSDTERGYKGQQTVATSGSGLDVTDPYRYRELSLWGPVITTASAMNKLEVENRALEREKEMDGSLKAAGAALWAMIVGLIVLAVLSIILVGVVVKMVKEKRRAPSVMTIEKPARSGAHYSAGMESVTVEEANHM